MVPISCTTVYCRRCNTYNSITFFCFPGKEQNGIKVTSLCSTLGKRHSVVKSGMCPASLKNPNGKEIPVSIIGAFPYVISDKEKGTTSGAAIEILDIYSMKLKFVPKILIVPSFDGEGGKVDTESINHAIFLFMFTKHTIFLNCR